MNEYRHCWEGTGLYWASVLSRRVNYILRIRHLHQVSQVDALAIISLHGFLSCNVLGMNLPFYVTILSACSIFWLLSIVCVRVCACARAVICLLW